VRLDYAPDLMRARAFSFVRTSAATHKPFFLFWATNLPHINNESSKAPDGGYEIPTLGAYADRAWPLAKKSYAAQVTRLDNDLGALRALVDSLGVSQNTMIVFLSDNGATFLKIADDGTSSVAGRWFDGTKNYRGFKGDLYDGGLRVPGVVMWPGVVRPGSQSAARLDFTDLHATLVDASGQTPPTAITGRSFLPVLTGRGTLALRPHLVWFSPDRNQSAVLEGKWKAVWFRDTLQLFDLERDPGERTDLAQSAQSVAAHLDSIRRAEDQRVQHPVKPRP
jgi:arylsulfatase A-like enzyme